MIVSLSFRIGKRCVIDVVWNGVIETNQFVDAAVDGVVVGAGFVVHWFDNVPIHLVVDAIFTTGCCNIPWDGLSLRTFPSTNRNICFLSRLLLVVFVVIQKLSVGLHLCGSCALYAYIPQSLTPDACCSNTPWVSTICLILNNSLCLVSTHPTFWVLTPS